MKHLAQTAWKTPDSYYGFDPVGDYLLMARCPNEGDNISDSNFRCARTDALAEAEKYPFDDPDLWIFERYNGDQSPRAAGWVYEWSVRHWAVGSVQYLMIRKDAPAELLKWADERLYYLDGYPVWNDDDLSELQTEIANRYWKGCSRKERARMLKEYAPEVSIFSVRRDYVPANNGELDQYLAQ